ncbi:hypothetical protein [Sessilibacter corallicola]|uniref:Auto-transporter adhesin head GIN domain-containing protein n=1 Tax=Sessilibacter corallicola TaxID=2904075 RepID=A0ABQ0A9I9_9GAMM
MQKVSSILLTLSVFLFIFYAQAIEMTVGAGQTKIIDSSFPKALDKLALEDGAKLVLGADETELRLTVQEMIMGKNVLISAQGKSAKNAVHLTGSESRRTSGAGTGSHGGKGASKDVDSIAWFKYN